MNMIKEGFILLHIELLSKPVDSILRQSHYAKNVVLGYGNLTSNQHLGHNPKGP